MKNKLYKRLLFSILAIVVLLACVGCDASTSSNKYKEIIDEDKLSYNSYPLNMYRLTDSIEKKFVKKSIDLANKALKLDEEDIRIITNDSAEGFNGTYFSLYFSDSHSEEMSIGLTDENEIILQFGEIIDTSNLKDSSYTDDALIKNKAKFYLISAMIVLSTSEFGSYYDIDWDNQYGGVRSIMDAENETARFYYAYDWAKGNYENLPEGKAEVRDYSKVRIWIQKDAFYLKVPESKAN